MESFLLSLAQLWNMRSVAILCPERNTTSSAAWNDFYLTRNDSCLWQSGISTLHLDVSEISSGSDIPPGVDLVYSPSALELGSLDQAGAFSAKEVHWLLPQDSVEDFKSLRLDSLVFTYLILEGGTVMLGEAYSVKKGPVIVKALGHWTQEQGLYMSETDYIWERRGDLGGIVLSNVMFDFPPFHWLVKEDGSSEVKDIDGFTAEVLRSLSKNLNFTVETHEALGGNAGTALNGTYSGAIGSLALGESDLSAALLTRTLERAKIVDFSSTLILERLTMTIVKPGGQGSSFSFSYAGEFGVDVWLAVIFTTVCLAMGFWLNRVLQRKKVKGSICRDVSTVMVLLIQKDCSPGCYPDSVTFRALKLCTGLLSILLLGFYTTLLTSSMIVRDPPPAMTSMQDVQDSDYRVIAKENNAAYEVLSQAEPGSILNQIYQEHIAHSPNSLFKQYQDIYDTLVHSRGDPDQKIAYFGSELAMMSFDNTGQNVEPMDLLDASSTHLGFGFPHNSELTQLFCFQLFKMEQSGQIHRIKRKWMPWLGPVDTSDIGGVQLHISFLNVSPLFLNLVLGVVCSVVLAIIERITFAIHRKYAIRSSCY